MLRGILITVHAPRISFQCLFVQGCVEEETGVSVSIWIQPHFCSTDTAFRS